MAEYYQNRFMDDLSLEFIEPMGFNDMSNVTSEIIISNMKAICDENKIPAHFRESSVEISEGLFNKATFKAIEISHPNPPQSYCKQLYVLYPTGIRFFFVGSSQAFSEHNNYEAALNGSGGNLKAKIRAMAGIEPNPEQYELEMSWHEAIYSVFQSLVE